MFQTKSYLSHGIAKVDHAALLTTARLAFGYAKERVGRHLDRLTFPSPTLKGCFYLETQYLAKEAANLVTVAETLYVLEGSLEREEFEIVNKPVVDIA